MSRTIDDGSRAIDEQHAKGRITAFRDAQKALFVTTGVLPRDKANSCGELASVLERATIGNGCHNRGCNHRPYAANGGYLLADCITAITAIKPLDLIISGFDPFVEGTQLFAEPGNQVTTELAEVCVRILDGLRQRFAKMAEMQRNDDAIFGEKASNLVPRLGSRTNQSAAVLPYLAFHALIVAWLTPHSRATSSTVRPASYLLQGTDDLLPRVMFPGHVDLLVSFLPRTSTAKMVSTSSWYNFRVMG